MDTPSGQDIVGLIWETREKVENLCDDLVKYGKQKSQTEMNYRIALAKKMRMFRANGEAVTIIGDLSRGDEEIAELKMLRDNAEVIYKAVTTKIFALRSDLEILRMIYKTEYQKGD